MRRYEYRCEQCRTTWPPVWGQRAAEDLAHWHRGQAHGGGIPDGETIRPYGPEPGERQSADPRQLAVAAAVLVVLLIAGWLHHL